MTRLDFPGPGTLVRHEVIPRERALAPRAVDVWLPPDHIPGTRRSVLYCADGQNLFRPVDSFAGVPWSLHTAALTAAAVTGRPTPVVVGVWNAGEGRYHEYLPPEPELQPSGAGEAHLALARAHGRRPDADAYLRLLADEVVPLVEGAHGIMTAATDRAAHGSSLGWCGRPLRGAHQAGRVRRSPVRLDRPHRRR